MNSHRCGTCRHAQWKAYRSAISHGGVEDFTVGTCAHPILQFLPNAGGSLHVQEGSGANCPCWQTREEPAEPFHAIQG